MEVVKKQKEEVQDYEIKPQATTPALDTSSWPLLLKNYDRRKSISFLMEEEEISRFLWGLNGFNFVARGMLVADQLNRSPRSNGSLHPNS